MSEEFDIEELLQTHLKDDRETVPGGVFEDIERTILTNEKRKKRLLIWWFLIGGVGLLILGFLAGYYFNHCNCSNTLHSSANGKALSPYIQQMQAVENTDEFESATELLPTVEQKKGAAINPDDLQQQKAGIKNKLTEVSQDEDKIAISLQPVIGTKTQADSNNNAPLKINRTTENFENAEHAENQMQKKGVPLAENNTVLKTDTVANVAPVTTTTNNTDAPIEGSHPTNDTLARIPQPISPLLFKPYLNALADLKPAENALPAKMGIIAYGGPTLYEIVVFKPYFEAGQLTANTGASRGVEFGLGVYRKLSARLEAQLMVNYNQKQTQFQANLMVSQADYFDLYLQNEPIPLENLDDPNSCNCFLVEDASLNYQINTFKLSLGGEFYWLNRQKLKLSSQFNISGNLSTTFNGNSNGVVAFPTTASEQFSTVGFLFGTGVSYQLSKKIQLGIMPSYRFVAVSSTSFIATPFFEFMLPVRVKFDL